MQKAGLEYLRDHSCEAVRGYSFKHSGFKVVSKPYSFSPVES
eukprot:IDg3089t1